MTEAQLQEAIIDTARLTGWLVAHFRAAKTSKGWRTPVSADGKGFPDLVLVRGRVVYMELKDAKRKVTPEQEQWIRALLAADQEAYIVRPESLSLALGLLARDVGVACGQELRARTFDELAALS